jgi:hypothetical protein
MIAAGKAEFSDSQIQGEGISETVARMNRVMVPDKNITKNLARIPQCSAKKDITTSGIKIPSNRKIKA